MHQRAFLSVYDDLPMTIQPLIIIMVIVGLGLLASGIRRVPKNTQLAVFQWSKFLGMRREGITFVIPFLEHSEIIELGDQEFIFQDQITPTELDNGLAVAVKATYRVVDPARCARQTYDCQFLIESTIQGLVMTLLRNVVPGLTLQEAQADRSVYEREILSSLSEEIDRYGCNLQDIEIVDFYIKESKAD